MQPHRYIGNTSWCYSIALWDLTTHIHSIVVNIQFYNSIVPSSLAQQLTTQSTTSHMYVPLAYNPSIAAGDQPSL